MPDSIIPERGQVSENLPQPSIKQSCHVFQQDPLRLCHANGSHDFGPKPATFSGNSGALSCIANILTWESRSQRVGQWVSGRANVPEIRYVGPMLAENGAGMRFGLALRDDPKAARSLKPEVNGPDARKHREGAEGH
ncbi:MAG: hypothetical protein Unbinned273contig1001_26 [Prokaryotic dsDNA virus sp.]|nr:MAG: hypothetical protein Unbinned273contig1001_26 [Prokaryotic dsDNA virus sp.]